MTNIDPHQRTGRTFRLLLKALLGASEGKNVCVVVYKNDYAMQLFDRAFDMAGHNAIKTYRLQMKIGNGTLLFSSPLKDLRKKEYLESNGFDIYYDHYRGEG